MEKGNMDFTYDGYERLIKSALEKDYYIINFLEYRGEDRVIFLRHDIDTSLKKAELISKIEEKLGVTSTYFLLLRTDFYNVASASSSMIIRSILESGHQIGLHFDETYYEPGEDLIRAIQKETRILSEICNCPIKTVSMHRPSKQTLDANIQIPGIINTYSRQFFEEVKYVSDSRRNWREPIEEYINEKKFSRLQILTHPFWYYEKELDIHSSIRLFIDEARNDRYIALRQNIRNFQEIIPQDEAEEFSE